MKMSQLFESLVYREVKGAELYRDLLTPDDLKSKRLKYLSQGWRDIDREIDLICLDGDRVVGVAGLQASPHDPKELWVKFVSVDPSARQQGIGKRLVAEIFKYASKHKFKIRNSKYTEMGAAYLSPAFDIEAEHHPDVPFKHGEDDTKWDADEAA